MNDAYVHARLVGERAAVSGTPSCIAGHPLDHCSQHGREGVFVQWHWDGRRLTVRNDRYGFHPCFYFQKDDEICVSPSILRLLKEGAPTDLDYPGLAVFLRMGFFIGEATPLKAIRALPPNACLEWEKGRCRVSGGPFIPEPLDISREEAMDTYIDLFEQAIRRRLPPSPDVALPLSSGKDSRHILFALCAAGQRPRFCITMKRFPPNANQDARIAPLLTRALNLDHVVLDQPKSEFTIELRKNVLTQFCSDEHEWVVAMADFLTGRVEAIYDGLGGDALSGMHLTSRRLALYQSGRLEELAADILRAPPPGDVDADAALERLLGRRESRKLGPDVAQAEMIPELRRHQHAPNPTASFLFWHFFRREIALAPYAMLGRIPTVFCPYLDHALYDFLSALPAKLSMDGTFHADTIRRGYPQYAHIPFDDKRARGRSTWQRDARFGREMASYLLRRRPSRWVRNRYLAPRLVAALLSPRYAASTRWFAPLATYLLHLESVANGTGWPMDEAGPSTAV